MAFTAEQQKQIATIWNDPNISMDQKMQAMTATGVGVTDIAQATGTDPYAVAYKLNQAGATGTFGGFDYSAFNAPAAPQTTTPQPQGPGLATTTSLSPQQQQSVYQFLSKNLNNPTAVIQAMKDYGVNVNDAAQAIGIAPTQFASWLVSNGASPGFGGYNPTATDYMVGFGKEAPGQTIQTPVQAALAAPNVVAGPYNGTAMQQVLGNYTDAANTGQKYLDSIRQQNPIGNTVDNPSIVKGLFAETFNKAGMTPSSAAADAAWNTVSPFGLVGQMSPDWAKNAQIPMTQHGITATIDPTTGKPVLTSNISSGVGGTNGKESAYPDRSSQDMANSAIFWGDLSNAASYVSTPASLLARWAAFHTADEANKKAAAEQGVTLGNQTGALMPTNPMALDPAQRAQLALDSAINGGGVSSGSSTVGSGSYGKPGESGGGYASSGGSSNPGE